MDLNRETTDPFGTTYHIVASRHYPGLFKIVNKQGKQNPKPIKGHYTNKDKAAQALHIYLSKAWAYSDAEAEKLAKRAGKKATDGAAEAR